MDTAPLPIVGTETYVSFADAHGLAGDRLNAREWRAAVEAYAAAIEAAQLDEATEPLPPLTEAIPTLCRQALTTATATLDRMPWKACRVPTQTLTWAAGSIPAPIATACAELAFYLLTAESRRRRGVQMSMVGQSMETYFPEVADQLPKHVRRLVEPFLRVRSTHSAELIP